MKARAVRKQQVKQCELEFRSWGGARRGSGRKPKGARALVPHGTRPEHKPRFPVLITSRLRAGLPSLRHAREAALIRAALAGANLAALASVAESQQASCPRANERDRKLARGRPQRRSGQPQEVPPFQVVHHSIQSNHLHLIVEAADRKALTSGMRGLLIRIARGLNQLWSRLGGVFADRFHEHELHKPREVRNALVYVLHNLRKHGIWMDGPDPLSSGPEFDGWLPKGVSGAGSGLRSGPAAVRWSKVELMPRGGTASCSPVAHLRAARADSASPKTWLLNLGWRRHGLIDLDERPCSR
jgi:hypothetical protein